MSIHFSELFIILLVSLLVMKPHHLLDIARILGRFIQWTQKMRREISVPFSAWIKEHEEKNE